MAEKNASNAAWPTLPVTERIGELRQRLNDGHVVLVAEPGSGKSTLVPLLLLDEPWLQRRKILLLQPRRPAARMVARRMASLCGEAVGGRVGYRVRFEKRVSAQTRIEVLTEGLLVRRLQQDPELNDVGLVIFDEFHERSLQADLSLTLCLDSCRSLRDDLRLLVMSATLETEPVAALLGAAVVRTPGRQHPVQINYLGGENSPRDLASPCVAAIARALDETAQDVLVFLPGRGEIERVRSLAVERWGQSLAICPLYGDMDSAAQDAALRGDGEQRRVILSTDIAETSLTIEGVDAVVDSGLARRPRFDPGNGLSRLHTDWISKASADQRAGRAGRLRPGHCFRLWNSARQARLPNARPAEILSADLASLVLELANWGVTSATQLSWLDSPPAAQWEQAVVLLRRLGALDAESRITASGRRMAQLPTHPRLAHLIAHAVTPVQRQLAADLAALLSERDPMSRRLGLGADLEIRLGCLRDLREGRVLPRDVDRVRLQHITRVAQQFLKQGEGIEVPGDVSTTAVSSGEFLALAYPDRVAIGDGARRFLLRNGRAAVLDELDPLCGSRYLVVADLDAGQRDGRIWLAATLSEEALERLFSAQIETRRELRWDEQRNDLTARQTRRLDALLLDEQALPLEPEDPVADLLIDQLRRQGLAAFFTDPANLRARVNYMRQLEPDADWPDCSEQGLLRSTEAWLVPWLKDGQGVRQLRSLDLRQLLEGWLGYQRVQYLATELPAEFLTPAGNKRRIDYTVAGSPVLALPLQEMLGQSEAPRLASGRLGVVLHLLSPAGRPLQVTGDLAGFWRGSYQEVKKEMRGRYPKHYWPDDPATAVATRHSKRRMR